MKGSRAQVAAITAGNALVIPDMALSATLAHANAEARNFSRQYFPLRESTIEPVNWFPPEYVPSFLHSAGGR